MSDRHRCWDPDCHSESQHHDSLKKRILWRVNIYKSQKAEDQEGCLLFYRDRAEFYSSLVKVLDALDEKEKNADSD